MHMNVRQDIESNPWEKSEKGMKENSRSLKRLRDLHNNETDRELSTFYTYARTYTQSAMGTRVRHHQLKT
jgi:hypothetical protein